MSFNHLPIKLEFMHTLFQRLHTSLTRARESRRVAPDGDGAAHDDVPFAGEMEMWRVHREMSRIRRQRAAEAAVQEARSRRNVGIVQAQQRASPLSTRVASERLASRISEAANATAYIRRRRLAQLLNPARPN